MLYMFIIHYVFLFGSEIFIGMNSSNCFILQEYVEILILFFWDSVNPGINMVAEIGESLNHTSLAQDQWICSTVNKCWFSQISHLSLMNLNSNVTHFSTVTSFCLFLSFYSEKVSVDNSRLQVSSSEEFLNCPVASLFHINSCCNLLQLHIWRNFHF